MLLLSQPHFDKLYRPYYWKQHCPGGLFRTPYSDTPLCFLPGSSWLEFHFGKNPRFVELLPPRPSPSFSASPAPQMWYLTGDSTKSVYVCACYALPSKIYTIIPNKRMAFVSHPKTCKHLAQILVLKIQRHIFWYVYLYVYPMSRNSNTHVAIVLLITNYIPFPHYTLCENRLLQRQHTHSHTKNPPGFTQITSNCTANAHCAKLSNIYCDLIIQTLGERRYSSLCV